MLLDNHKNNSCGYSEDLVAYLYGESDAKQKAKFETHLNKCSNCAEELTDFGFVRSSISNWHQQDFAGLTLPEIEIPYQTKSNTGTTVSSEMISWVDRIRQLFSANPAWATATAGFAILVFCAVIALTTFSGSDNNYVANSNNEQKSTAPVLAEKELPLKNIEPEQITQPDSNETNKEADSPREFAFEKEAKQSKPLINRKKNQPTKNVERLQNTSKQKTNKQSEIKKPDESLTAINNNQDLPSFDFQEAPNLSNFTDEDDENDMLTLSTLLDEIEDN